MIKYKVKARLARNLGTDDFELEEFEEIFIDQENPIEARKRAYRYYESILDILGADVYEESSISAKINMPLANYLKKIDELPVDFEFPKSYPTKLGVGLYFFSNNENLLSKQEDYFIMGFNDYSFTTPKNLELEKKVYDLNKWDTQNWITTIKYYDIEKHTLSTIYVEDPKAVVFTEVLWCPTDFWSKSNPTTWLEDDSIDEEERIEEVKRQLELQENEGDFDEDKITSFEKSKKYIEKLKGEESLLSKIINQGENRKLEFKSSLRYCLKTNKPQEYIEHGITKTISAFANTEGGLLLIGVGDDGELFGLNNDINSFRSKSQDSFLKHFDNLIRDHFSAPIDAIIKYGFEKINTITVFKVEVDKSSKPRFLITKKRGKEFYIRRSASTNSLDIEEAAKYIIDKWYERD